VKTLVEELKQNHDAILDELKKRAQAEMQGTLYQALEQQKVLAARYENVVDVIIDYLTDGDTAMLIQHHIIMFMQRFYVSLDAENPLTVEIIHRRTGEIHRMLAIYFEVWRQFTSTENHPKLDETLGIISESCGQMAEFLKKNLDTLATRLPLVKLRDIEYEEGSQFDIDPDRWPQ
jgi:hypothetical protein